MPIAPVSSSRSKLRKPFLQSLELNKVPSFAESTSFRLNGKSNPLKFSRRLAHPLLANNGDPRKYIIAVAGSKKFHKNGKLEKATLAGNQVVQGIPLPKGTAVEFWDDAKLYNAVLPSAWTVQGIMCAKGRIWFSHSGTISDVTLAARQKIQGIFFPKGTRIEFTDKKKLKEVRLSSNLTIKGIPAAGGIKCPYISLDVEVQFHPNGMVRQALLTKAHSFHGTSFPKDTQVTLNDKGKLVDTYLPRDMTIKGIKWAGGTRRTPGGMGFSQTGVKFYGNGKIAGGHLASDTTIQGIKCQRAKLYSHGFDNYETSSVSFHTNGKLKSAYLSQDQVIMGVKCAKDNGVAFHPNGKLKSASLAKSQVIQGVHCSNIIFGLWPRPDVTFHPNGKLESARLWRNQVIRGIPCSGDIYLYKNGRVSRTELSRDATISGIRCKAKTWIKLYPNGRLESGTIARDRIIWNTKFPAGSEIRMNKRGKITRVTLTKDSVIGGKLHKSGTYWGK